MESHDPSASSSVLKRLGRNFTILFSGAAAASLLGLGALALNTRALGPTQFGIFVLIQAYAVLVGRIFSFDTWQSVVRFGAESQARGDTRQLLSISSFAILFDLASALAAGTVGLLVLLLLPAVLGITDEYFAGAAIYTAFLFLQLPGAPVGILRLFDKFSWLTAITVAEAAARLAVSIILFLIEAPLEAYLLAFGAILAAASLVRLFASLRLLRAATGQRGFAARHEMQEVQRRFVRFSAGSWLTGTLNVTRRDGTTLIIAALLGPAAAGLYGVAARIVRPIRDLAELLRQAAFPDLSKLVADSRHQNVSDVVRRVMIHTLPLAAAITVAGFLVGDIVIELVAGPAFADAYWPLAFLIAAASLYLCTPFLSSLAILYTGMRRYTLGAAAAAAIWAVLFIWPMLKWGVAGAGVGELVYVLAWIGINLALLARAHRRRIQSQSAC